MEIERVHGGVIENLMGAAEIGTLWGSADASASRRKRRNNWSISNAGGGTRRVTAKRRGEMAEAAFVAKATALGFSVAKPWGDSDPYDFIIHAGGKLWKVQVKSAHRPMADKGYAFSLERTDERPYSADQIDALAAYIVPDNVWYVFPVHVIARLHAIELFPAFRRRTSKYEKYREAWGMFKAPGQK